MLNHRALTKAAMEARGGVLGTPANLTAADRSKGRRLSAARSKASAQKAYTYIVQFMREERRRGASCAAWPGPSTLRATACGVAGPGRRFK